MSGRAAGTGRVACRGERGYALIFVTLIMIVVGLAVGLLMDRVSSSQAASVRRVQQYKQHHFRSAVMELCTGWVRTAVPRSGSVFGAIGGDGRAFAIEVSDGRRLRVEMRDGQASALSNTQGLAREDARLAERILEQIRFMELEDEAGEGWTRPAGPLAVSLRSAPVDLVEAVLAAVVDLDEADSLAARLDDERRNSDAGLTSTSFSTMLEDTSMDEGERAQVRRLLTVEPTLFEIEAVLTDRRGEPLQRGRGLVDLSDRASLSGSDYDQLQFLTWESLPPEPEDANESGRYR